MCPNMNHFDAVDFSECRSEEVISFIWRSVYIQFALTRWRLVSSTLRLGSVGNVCYGKNRFVVNGLNSITEK